MKVLCVAEKPSIARSVSTILSGGQITTVRPEISQRPCRHTDRHGLQRNTADKYVKNYDFIYAARNANYTVTAVRGHLFQHDFPDGYRKWTSCEPFDLFDAPIETMVSKDCKGIERNLMAEARGAQMLMIWTDCDREGENIGAEIVQVCRKANRNIQVKRARFSAIIAQYATSLPQPVLRDAD